MPVPVSWMFSGVEFKIWKHKQFIVKQQQILQGTLSDQVLSVQHSLLAVWHRRVFSASGHHKFSHYYTKTAYHVQFEYIPLCKLYTDCIESSSKFTVFSSYALSLSSVSCVVGSVYFMDNCLEGTLNFVLKIKAYLTRIFAFSLIFIKNKLCIICVVAFLCQLYGMQNNTFNIFYDCFCRSVNSSAYFCLNQHDCSLLLGLRFSEDWASFGLMFYWCDLWSLSGNHVPGSCFGTGALISVCV